MKLKELREKKGWTQGKLGAKIGVSGSTISCWERGITYPRDKHIAMLALALDTSASYLLSLDPHRTPLGIQDVRKKHGLAVEEMASLLDVDPLTVRIWESQRMNNLDDLIREIKPPRFRLLLVALRYFFTPRRK